MKRIIPVTAGLFMLMNIFFSTHAYANIWYDNFDGAGNINWRYTQSNAGSMVEANEELNFIVPEVVDPYSNAVYWSDLSIPFSSNFQIKTEFSSADTIHGDELGYETIYLGLISNGLPVWIGGINARYYKFTQNAIASKDFLASFNGGYSQNIYQPFNRTISNGWIGVQYFQSSDELEILATTLDDPNFLNPVLIYPIENYHDKFGSAPVMPYLSGYSDGFTVSRGEMTFDNFQIRSGEDFQRWGGVVPEPATSILFLFGASAMFARRYVRHKKPRN